MVAGVKDRGGNYRKNKQVEWTIDCSSPGGFIDVDRRDWCDLFAGEWDPPRIENPRHAFTSTSRKPLRLTKGTTTPLDDVVIHEGQTWTAISSPCEGTTKLTAVALDSNDWQRRLRAAHIHWIDAWPILPPAKIAQNYSQALRLQSSVFRANGSAALGCIAVYEIVSGDDVEFKTDSENSNAEKITQIIVPVGGNGIAEAQLVKKSASAGQTKIRTTLIRDNSDGRFTVPIRLAQGETTVDWGETGLLISRSGPAIISGGTEASYRITVQNVNSETLNEIVVTDTVPESFEYQRSVPVGRVLDALVTNPNGTRSQKIQWTIPSLDSGQTQTFDVIYRPQYEGDYNLISTAQTGSVQAEDVLRTRVVSPGGYPLQQTPAPTSTPSPLSNQDSGNIDLDIQIVCQDRASIGSEVVMNVYVKNNGSGTLTNILSSVTFTAGLCSSVGASPVHLKPMDYIEPGMTRDVRLTFSAIANGRQTINLELIAPNGQRFNRQVFVTVEGDACQTQAGASIYPTDVNESPDSNQNSILESDNSRANNNLIAENSIILNVTAPSEVKTGEEIQITLDIGNRSSNNLCNIRLACFLDNNFEIVRNTTGLVTANPRKPYWDVLTPIPPNSGSRYYIVVKCNSAMPTISSFVVQQGNTDLIKKDCQITVTQSSNLNTVQDTNLPDNVDASDSLDPIPDVSMPEPDTAPMPESDLPSLDDSSLEVPTLEEPGAESLDVPAPELPNLDVPDVNNEQTSVPNDKINVEITTRRSSIKTNQTFTCQINLTNNTSETMNDVVLAFYFPMDSFKLIKLGTTGATQYDYNALGGFVTFKPATLEPGQSLKYYVRLLPQRNGITELSAAITAKESGTTDVQQNAKITVNVE